MNSRGPAFAVVRAIPDYPWRLGAGCAAVTAVGVLADAASSGVGGEVTAVGLLATAGTTGWWWFRHVLRPQSTKHRLQRSSDRIQRSAGVASWMDIAEVASPAALRARAGVLRPSLADQRGIPATELGVLVATLGIGRLPGQQVWSSVEDVTLRIGGPRTGKTQALACHGLDAPGALVTTSTRLDLARNVQCARGDRAVHVMNIAGIGGVPSTVRWSILTGCADFATAARRAGDLIPEGSRAGDGEYWAMKARAVLALLLHAAARDGRSAQDVVRWAAAEPATRAAEEVIDVLASVDGGGKARAAAWRQHLAENDRTRTSVTATITPALAWLADDVARPIGDSDPETTTLDVRRLILDAETLHLVDEPRTGAAPLVAAIVAEVAHQARRLAADMPEEKLDPPLTILLDEAALICPVPLPDWTAHFGGSGITLHVSIQSLAQLRDRWGIDGAAAVRNNVGTMLVFGGSKDDVDLQAISTLTGEHRQKVLDADGKKDDEWFEHRWIPVLSPAEIAALKLGEVLVLRRGLHAVIGWAPQVKDRPDWQRAPLPGEPEPGTLQVATSLRGIEVPS